jgi:hypothetical protein
MHVNKNIITNNVEESLVILVNGNVLILKWFEICSASATIKRKKKKEISPNKVCVSQQQETVFTPHC